MDNRAEGAVAWADRPDPDRRPFYEIRSPTPDRDVQTVVLSANVLGVYTHHMNRRTRPCLGSRESCEGCDLKYDRRWKGYLACWDRSKGRLELVELTQEAFLRCPAFHTKAGQLRGMVLRLARAGASKNARVTATVTPATWPPNVLPVAFDVKAALERVWFTDHKPLERFAPTEDKRKDDEILEVDESVPFTLGENDDA